MPDAPKKSRRPRKKPVRDLALVAGPTDDGEGAHVLRLRDGTLSAGELRPLREGHDVRASELVRLHALPGQERAYQVEVLHDAPASKPAQPEASARTAGPARVSNPDYRRNFDRVFGPRGHGSSDRDYSVN